MKTDSRDIYEQIGNLFYSIAKEQHVKPLEIAELKMLISKDWLPRDTSEPMTSIETHCILLTMDTLQGNDSTAQDAYGDFTKFYALHPEAFTMELKQRIFDTASEITKIFEADNKIGNKHFMRLKELLQLPAYSKA
jgi:hypothetical protein